MSLELGAWALGVVLLACVFSGFAHGAIGFGFPIVATPLIALVIDIKTAIALDEDAAGTVDHDLGHGRVLDQVRDGAEERQDDLEAHRDQASSTPLVDFGRFCGRGDVAGRVSRGGREAV